MRSRSRRVLGVALAVALVSGCRAFVDLDGLQGGADGVGDGAPDAVEPSRDGGDATTTDGFVATDSTVTPDVFVDSGGCPSKGGPAPVLVVNGQVRFCIDSSEVTNDQYDAFLKSTPTQQATPAYCAWNDNFMPQNFPFDPAAKDMPVAVDWCDAYAFCKWAGKRLCGKIGGGGNLTPAEAMDPTKSEFIHACTKGGAQDYPYGTTYTPNACNGGEGQPTPHAAKALATCTGGFPGIFDLAGNMHEHIDSCVPGTGGFASDTCYMQLSAWSHSTGDMKCAGLEPWARGDRNEEVGFRCCSDAP